jgi:hypothetical protein
MDFGKSVWWRLKGGQAKRKGPFPGGKRVGSWEKKKVKVKVKE